MGKVEFGQSFSTFAIIGKLSCYALKIAKEIQAMSSEGGRDDVRI